jgi:hypothetical protein
MNDGLLTIAELVFLLDDGRAVATSGLPLFGHSGTVPFYIAMLGRYTDGYTAAYGAYPNSNVPGERRCCNSVIIAATNKHLMGARTVPPPGGASANDIIVKRHGA